FASRTQPFTQSGNAVSYAGSDGVSQLQISANQRISGGDAGDAVFMSIPAGNGTFTTAANAANTGSGSIDGGSVVDLSQWTPDTYTIAFTSATQYQVTDSSGNVVTSGNYTNGSTIQFQGIAVTVNGSPAA